MPRMRSRSGRACGRSPRWTPSRGASREPLAAPGQDARASRISPRCPGVARIIDVLATRCKAQPGPDPRGFHTHADTSIAWARSDFVYGVSSTYVASHSHQMRTDVAHVRLQVRRPERPRRVKGGQKRVDKNQEGRGPSPQGGSGSSARSRWSGPSSSRRRWRARMMARYRPVSGAQ